MLQHLSLIFPGPFISTAPQHLPPPARFQHLPSCSWKQAIGPLSNDIDPSGSSGSSDSRSYDGSSDSGIHSERPPSRPLSQKAGPSETPEVAPAAENARELRRDGGSGGGSRNGGGSEDIGGGGEGDPVAAQSMTIQVASLATAIGTGIRGFLGRMTQSTMREAAIPVRPKLLSFETLMT
jgi:hypothetical protein